MPRPRSDYDARSAESHGLASRETVAQSRVEGRKAGLLWASDEAQRGYSHPWRIEPGRRMRIVIHHARQAFQGRCVGQRHSFLRGFIEGAAEFWDLQNGQPASRGASSEQPAKATRALLPAAAVRPSAPQVPSVPEP